MPTRRKPAIKQEPLDIKKALADFKQKETSLWVPDVIEFTLSDQFLYRTLYPRQATMLKIAFLQDDLFTDYDYEVIDEWTRSFRENEDHGTQPDILERIKICKQEGRPWFREWIAVLGRRSGKGHLGAIAGAYVLWNYICKKDPQKYYNIDRSKAMAMFVFGSKYKQAVDNLWKDLANYIKDGPCFAPYISRPQYESLSIFAPADFEKMEDRKSMGAYGDEDMATFRILPKEATPTAARGYASFAQMYDEFAWVSRQFAKSDASEVWDGATPALDTFGKDAWIYEPSSPFSKTGQFYDNWLQSLAISDGLNGFPKGTIMRPEICMFQLASWDNYIDYERMDEIMTMPEQVYSNPTKIPKVGSHPGRKFPLYFIKNVDADGKVPDPPQLYNDQMRRMQAANPEAFAVDRLAHWASVMDAYLNPERVEAVFQPWPEENPMNAYMKDQGSLAIQYKFHGDPSKSGANFGWAGAHVVHLPGEEFPHVIFDVIHHWDPATFPDHLIDYDQIEDEIKIYIAKFMPSELTFDQGFSNMLISRLQKWVRTQGFPRQINVFERTATASQNWIVAETFKTAIGLGLVHAPEYDQAKQEMLFLQLVNESKVDKPDSGPVQTKDVFDAMSIVVHALIGNEIAAFINQDLSAFVPKGSMPGGLPTQMETSQQVFNQLSGWARSNNTGYSGSPARGRQAPARFGRRSRF